MKVLYIGGTGEISYSCVQRSVERDHQVAVFNRGLAADPLPDNVRQITGELGDSAYEKLGAENFDAVCQFIAYTPEQLECDLRVFGGRCGQYVFISTAMVYQKPWHGTIITENVPRGNPFSRYAQDKLICEQRLAQFSAEKKFRYTIVRPSHTYRKRFPSGICSGDDLAWRIVNGKPVILHGDGTNLWTYTHTEDFAAPFVELLGNENALGRDFHITRHLVAHPWKMIYEEFGRALGAETKIVNVPANTLVKYKPELESGLIGDKIYSLVFDNSKVIEAAGYWENQIPLEQGAQRLAENFLRHTRPKFVPDLPAHQLIDRIIAEQSALGDRSS